MVVVLLLGALMFCPSDDGWLVHHAQGVIHTYVAMCMNHLPPLHTTAS